MSHLHPPTVHFPIAFLSFATLGDLIGLAIPKVTDPANLLLALGTTSALLTVMTGLLDLSNLKPQPKRTALAQRHLTLAGVAWVCYGASLALRLSTEGLSKPGPAALTFSVLGLTLLLLAAHFGGRLVFDHGAGLAPTLLNDSSSSIPANTKAIDNQHDRRPDSP